MKGRVAWARSEATSHAAGVRFEVISDEQKTWLRQVLNEMGAPTPAR